MFSQPSALKEIAELLPTFRSMPDTDKKEFRARVTGRAGIFLLDRCAENPNFLTNILDAIINDLANKVVPHSDPAKKACDLIEELSKAGDTDLHDSLLKALDRYPSAKDQLPVKSLSAILIEAAAPAYMQTYQKK